MRLFMGKYEELDKLQKLKESGTITEAEFETEKSKVLNEEKQGLTKKQKNVLTGVLTIVIIVGVIAGLCMLADGMWSSSGEHGKYQTTETLKSR
jgi:hypothetical protein